MPNTKLPVGSIVVAGTNWTEYSVQEIASCRVARSIEGLDLGHFLGALGLTGLTAYYGIREVAAATRDDTVVVSGAAGATGSMVVQIAKKIIGCSDDKCRWVEKLGADVCVNYQKDTFKQDLIRETEGFVDVYFDNVGGDILHEAPWPHRRIAACGSIANYNKGETAGLKNSFEIVSNRLHIHGFIVLDYLHKFPDVVAELVGAWKEGKIILDDSMQTVVDTKFEDVPKTWLKLFEGGNTGKLITRIVQ